jgi:hypothetical protein
MKNFNIRYECLNQRDDFFSELKKGATAVPGLINDDLAQAEMNQTAVLDEVLPINDDMSPNDIDIDDQQSQRYKQQLKTMSTYYD